MTLRYKQILVAVDGSKEAELAFRKSVDIALRNGAALHLVSIINDRALPGNKAFDRAVLKRAREPVEALMGRYKEKALESGVEEVTVIIEPGSPKSKISRGIASEVQADLIVCGAAGLNRLERYVLGSVSQHIVRSSKCDVLVVKTEEPVSDSGEADVGVL